MLLSFRISIKTQEVKPCSAVTHPAYIYIYLSLHFSRSLFVCRAWNDHISLICNTWCISQCIFTGLLYAQANLRQLLHILWSPEIWFLANNSDNSEPIQVKWRGLRWDASLETVGSLSQRRPKWPEEKTAISHRLICVKFGDDTWIYVVINPFGNELQNFSEKGSLSPKIGVFQCVLL